MTAPAKINTPTSPLHSDEAHARIIKILEATTDVVAMTDRSGQLLYMNVAGRRLFGWGKDDIVVLRNVKEMHPAWAYEVVQHESFPTALRDSSWSGETALLAENGREVPVLQVVLAHTSADGEVDFYSTICRDISERKQKELEQIEWANRYDAAIRASGQVLFDWDAGTGDINYGGDVEGLFGRSDEEMHGGLTRMRQMIHPDDLPAFDAEIERVIATRDPFHNEFRFQRKDGSEVLVQAQGFFFLDRQGRIGRMVGFIKDISLQRVVEHAVQTTNEALEKRVAERTAALERANAELQSRAHQQEAVALLGQRALTGLPLDDLMREAAEVVRNGLPAGCSAVHEFNEDDECFYMRAEAGWPAREKPTRIPGGDDSMSAYTLRSGETVVSPDFSVEERFTISEDIRRIGARSGVSVRIQAGKRPLGVLNAFSRSLRTYAPDDLSFLQAVANVLSAAFERHQAEEHIRQAQAEAEAANRGKSEFLSRMSHELRTPLNSILGFTQLLEMEEHDARQEESIRHISRAGQNLLALINEVLDISRLDAGRMQFQMEALDLSEFLHETTTLTLPLATRNKVTVRLAEMPPETPFVSTDRERIKQVLLNLLSNAVKFNREGGSVTIAAARAEQGFWRVSVTDTGMGIPKEKLDRLFVPFERLGTKEGGTEGGTGLGLALCQRLVKALNGRLGAASTVGLGSTFWIDLPTIEMPAIASTPSVTEKPIVIAPQQAHYTLLYIEDDLANYYLLERILAPRKDIKLLSALQGRLGLDLAREHQPDLLLLDLNLPDMPGEQLLRILKDDPSTTSIPVIAVTGEVASDRSKLLLQLGALDILTKPYRVQELLTLLDKALGQRATPPQ